jgi:hypothetical protein
MLFFLTRKQFGKAHHWTKQPNASEWHELAANGVEGMKALKGFNAATPRLRFNASFYAVDIRGSLQRFVPQIPGILEIQLIKGEKLKAVNLDGSKSFFWAHLVLF